MQSTRTRSAELIERRGSAVARGVSAAFPLVVERAEGALLWDADGREFVDFAGGIGTLNLGHTHPAIVRAAREQLERLTHTCFQVGMYEGYVELAERLNALMPGPGPNKTLLLSTGAEATENAVKIARQATGRPGIVAFTFGYHGRTLLALTLTGKVAPYRQNFGPFAAAVYHAPFPNPRRGWDAARSLAAIEELFATDVSPDQVAAFIVEPVLGEGGFVPAPFEFLQGLRTLADRHGILLIADEIQTGFGRTGTMFAVEQAGIVPDLMTLAKSLAGGLPLSAVVGRAAVMDAVEPGGLGGTYAGNPVACAAALATLEIFADGALLSAARRQAATLRERLEALARRYPAIVDVRGLGAMQALELEVRPDAAGRSLAARISTAAFERGVVILTAGPQASTLRFLIPLVATDTDIARGLEALEGACEHVLQSL